MLLGGLVCLGVSSCIWGSVCIWGIGICWALCVRESVFGDMGVWESYVCLGGFCMYFGLHVLGSFVCMIHMCLGVMHVSGDPGVLGTCGF